MAAHDWVGDRDGCGEKTLRCMHCGCQAHWPVGRDPNCPATWRAFQSQYDVSESGRKAARRQKAAWRERQKGGGT